MSNKKNNNNVIKSGSLKVLRTAIYGFTILHNLLNTSTLIYSDYIILYLFRITTYSQLEIKSCSPQRASFNQYIHVLAALE